ncbi:MAG: N-acetylmuramoyl-L-alanine amidase [Prosthecobacter sp.]|uniref:N-acetylmuramoyl-L-alanine amidase n=1 Tax=Prosthecobacter sp. TaxID=1965333 RepID=UPI003902CBF8
MKFRLFIALALQTLAAFSALGGSALALVWLEQRQASLPSLVLPRWDETAPLVIVDAGHGGHDGGAVANGIIEKNLALDLARRLQRELEAAGLRVRLTRGGDTFLPLEARAALAGTHQAAAFVSVHLNTDGEGHAAEGIETYFAESQPLSSRQHPQTGSGAKTGTSADFASTVQRMVCTTTKAQNRGTKARSYAVVAQAPCPAVLVECGFITSATESARLKRDAYRDQIAAGIARGVALFLQIQPKLVAGS